MPWILQPNPSGSTGITGPASAPVSIPHWNYPVTFNLTTGVSAVQQDTLEEVFANVQMIAVCPQGACPEIPTMGVPSVVFGQAPLNPAPIVAAIAAQEPRATETALSQAYGDPDYGTWLIGLTTKYAGGDQ